MRHADIIKLSDTEKIALEQGQKFGKLPRFRRRCHGILLKSAGKTNKEIAEILGCSHVSVYLWQQAYKDGGIKALEVKSVQRHKPILNKEEHEKAVRKAVSENRESLKSAKAAFEKETGISVSRSTLRRFFRTLGAGYKRIRLTPKGEPSPQILESAVERLQELDRLEISGHIDLVFGDESHVCTSGYVPYGWQFPDEKVSIRVEKCGRLNIFGMISRNNKYHGFTSTESINSDRFIEYMDEYTLTLKKLTVLVLDNASIHKSKKVKERVEDWKKRGLYIFYLPPYSPHLNLAETLWRILKGKWIKPEHYISKDTLFNAVQNILGGIGSEYKVRYSHAA